LNLLLNPRWTSGDGTVGRDFTPAFKEARMNNAARRYS
jgi:hypothetical protein